MKVYKLMKGMKFFGQPLSLLCLPLSTFQKVSTLELIAMVSYKGFNIYVCSQIDAEPVPEFSTAQGFGASSSISCYVPIYPGAQIWIEYSVDRPQPPEAIYLFKLFISGHFVTSWVST